MGRKPAKNPKAFHLGLRIEPETAAAINREIEREMAAKPGLVLGRSAMVRILMAEALLARAGKKSSPRTR